MTGRVGPRGRRGLLEAAIAGLVVIGLGLLALVGAAQVRPVAGYTVVGPAVMPAVVGVALVALGSLLVLRATVRPDLDQADHIEREARATDWRTTGLTLGALVGYAVALGPLGYVLSTSVFLPLEAAILGSRRPVRDGAVGIVLAVVVYVVFTRFLSVRLPAGLLEPLLP
ncbi:MAG TPA: tripartite tricarboxylate transporter TctB family protein [Candidatus Limnocylindrales bacterium]|nr:tripartite tricarboxylate transporter TctB family protein [Candidatus Limnocylindrales bacterium]